MAGQAAREGFRDNAATTPIALAATGMLAIAMCPAHAGPSLTIAPASGEQDVIDDLGGNVPPAGLPLGLTGYTTQSWLAGTPPSAQLVDGPNLMAGGAGDYTFTFLGKGDAAHHDIVDITMPGGATGSFDNFDGLFSSLTLHATGAGEIQFTFQDLTDGAVISSSPSSANNNFAASYFLGVAGSSHCIDDTDPHVTCDGIADALTGPSGTAFIGLSDDPWNGPAGDHDFQDLGLRVTTPEPVSLALLGSALAGLGFVRRRRRQV